VVILREKRRMTMSGALAGLGWTAEDVAEAEGKVERLDAREPRDGRVCMCGHGAGRHRWIRDRYYCSPSRMRCRCEHLAVAGKTTDLRYFICKTEGPGEEHALVRGILRGERNGAGWEWEVAAVCGRCKSEGKVVPAAVTSTGLVSDRDEALNVMACEACIRELRVGELR
jgi:hypothetical protein